jgi:general secretion pathway protein G
MLVVIGIIGLIAAVLTPGIIGQFARAKAKAAQLQLDTLTADMESFSSDVGRYPTQQEGLKALLIEPASVEGWSGPYVRDARMLNDPWGQPIVYALDAQTRSFTVESLGADAKPGGRGVDRDLRAPAAAASADAASAPAPTGGTPNP